MRRHVQLDPVAHHGLHVDTRHGARFGDDVMVAPTFPAEFRELQAHYPIVFHADAAQVTPVALLGLRHGQNLFIDPTSDRWQAHYVPLAIARGPFLVGVDGVYRTLHVDLDHPRLQSGQGEALFLPHGGFAPHLLHMQTVLQRLYDGQAQAERFVQALRSHALLETFTLDVTLEDGRNHRLSGFQMIDEPRLHALPPAAIAELHTAGHLEPIYMAIASASRFRDLIERLERRHGDA